MVDWLTVTAQIANFLILIALLTRFLYRPISANMEARKQHIEARLNEAGQVQAKAERLIAAYREKLTALEEDRTRLLGEARREAAAEREALLEKARLEVEEKRRQWQQALAREQAALLRELKTLVAEQVVELARKALRDLAGQELEERLIDSCLQQLSALPDEQRRLLESATDWVVVTSLPLPPAMRERIQAALERLRPGVVAQFEQRGDLVCGIALEASGRLWRWNLAAYLDELEARLRQALPGTYA